VSKEKPVASHAEVDADAENSASQLLVNWDAEGWGFGQLLIYEQDGGVHADNECMSKRFCLTVLEKLIEGKPPEQWPPMVRLHGSCESLLDKATPRNSGPDWGHQ
jgi:hypothetical protein